MVARIGLDRLREYLRHLSSLSPPCSADMRFVAGADINRRRGQAPGGRFGLAQARSVSTLLGSRRISTSSSTSPSPRPMRSCQAAISAGKHVYTEKPLATRLDGWRAADAACPRQGPAGRLRARYGARRRGAGGPAPHRWRRHRQASSRCRLDPVARHGGLAPQSRPSSFGPGRTGLRHGTLLHHDPGAPARAGGELAAPGRSALPERIGRRAEARPFKGTRIKVETPHHGAGAARVRLRRPGHLPGELGRLEPRHAAPRAPRHGRLAARAGSELVRRRHLHRHNRAALDRRAHGRAASSAARTGLRTSQARRITAGSASPTWRGPSPTGERTGPVARSACTCSR